MIEVTCVADTSDVLGEVPRWHAGENALYWIDALKPAIHRLDPAGGEPETWTPPEKLGSFAPSAAGGLIIAGRKGFALYDPRTGAFERFSDPENEAKENILNDGRCDPRGRFWAGSMTKTMAGATGTLYCVERGRTEARETGIWVSNGLAWSPDGGTMYFADSHRHTIFAYDYDLAKGALGSRRVLVDTSGRPGVPDGASCDADGCLWTAMFDGACLARYTPSGKLDRVVDLPVSRPTACTFGGPGLRTMYVTTARFRLTPEKLAREPYAGGLLALDVGVAGLPEPMYQP